jgi:hypothetical protein
LPNKNQPERKITVIQVIAEGRSAAAAVYITSVQFSEESIWEGGLQKGLKINKKKLTWYIDRKANHIWLKFIFVELSMSPRRS